MDSQVHGEGDQTSFAKFNSVKSNKPAIVPDSFAQPETWSLEETPSIHPKTASTGGISRVNLQFSDICDLHQISCSNNEPCRSKPSEADAQPSICSSNLCGFSKWLNTFVPKNGKKGSSCLGQAALYPPISTESLATLEIEHVLFNRKLRHDMNFDRDIRFKPNRDRASVKLAEDYWIALETELELYEFLLYDTRGEEHRWTEAWIAEFQKQQKRIPAMFETMKDIIFSMMPSKDQPKVLETLDITLIMERIVRGNLDLCSLATWLSTLLKSHCAPIRDSCVDRMVAKMTGFPGEAAPTRIVNGLKELFGVLEAMKLDIINHQLRVLRPRIINATAVLEHKHILNQLGLSKHYLTDARNWLMCDCCDGEGVEMNKGSLSRFVFRLTSSLSSMLGPDSHICHIPATFCLDFDRLLQVLELLSGAVNEEICVIRFKCILFKLQLPTQEVETRVSNLRSSISTIVENFWHVEERIFNVAAEMARLATIANPAISDRSNSVHPAEINHKSGPGNTRLTDLIEETGRQLLADLEVGGALHLHHLDIMGKQLFTGVSDLVAKHFDDTPLQLTETLVSQSYRENKLSHLAGPAQIHQHQQLDTNFGLICRRLAHIIILQWNAWGYMLANMSDEEPAACEETDESSELAESSESERCGSRASSTSCMDTEQG